MIHAQTAGSRPRDGDLRKACITRLRFRLFQVPGEITRGQGKTWLHQRTPTGLDPRLTTAWLTSKSLPMPI